MQSTRYRKLRTFLTRQMRMNHIYQPAMLLELLKSNGEATVRQLAEAFLARDVSQIEYYEEVTNRMPGRVLASHNITKKLKVSHRRSDNKYSLLGFEELSSDEVDSLVSLCEQSISDYIKKHRKGIWSHRNRAARYISGSLRYRILAKGKLRCALCFETEKALDVDHIVPRKHRGSDDESNLQVLCYTCNRSKGASDDTSFARVTESYEERDPNCAFCDLTAADQIDGNLLAVAIHDQHPVAEGHTLIVPRRHISSYFGLYQPELNAINQLLQQRQRDIRESFSDVVSFNIGVNDGPVAGQTVDHCHVHLIPRREGDVKDPTGGVRGVIPSKRTY